MATLTKPTPGAKELPCADQADARMRGRRSRGGDCRSARATRVISAATWTTTRSRKERQCICPSFIRERCFSSEMATPRKATASYRRCARNIDGYRVSGGCLSPNKNIGMPYAENDEYLMMIGIGGSLDQALQRSTTAMARWLEREYKLNSNEAALVLGFALEIRYRRPGGHAGGDYGETAKVNTGATQAVIC